MANLPLHTTSKFVTPPSHLQALCPTTPTDRSDRPFRFSEFRLSDKLSRTSSVLSHKANDGSQQGSISEEPSMLSTTATDLRRTLKSHHLLSHPSHKSHESSPLNLRKNPATKEPCEASPIQDQQLKHLLTAVRRTTLSTRITDTRNNLTLPSNYFTESGGSSLNPIHSFQLAAQIETPRPPTQKTPESHQSNTSTAQKPFCSMRNPVQTKLKELKKQGYVWWGSFGADALTHDIPIQVGPISIRSELISIRGYALEFKPLKSNILLPVLVRRKEKSAILRADLVPGEALKVKLKISLSSYAKSIQRIKSEDDTQDRAYDAVIRATHLEEIPLYFPTSSLYAKLALHMEPELSHTLPSPLCIASMLNDMIPLREAPSLVQLESLFLYLLNSLKRQIARYTDKELEVWKVEIKENLIFEGSTTSDGNSTIVISPRLIHGARLSAVVEESESYNEQKSSTPLPTSESVPFAVQRKKSQRSSKALDFSINVEPTGIACPHPTERVQNEEE